MRLITLAAALLLATAARAADQTTITNLPLLGAVSGTESIPVEILNPNGTSATKRIQVRSLRCPGTNGCALLTTFLPALQTLVGSGVSDVRLDLETSIPLSSPAWLEWQSGRIIVDGPLATLIAARYAIPATGPASMASLFAAAN